MTDKLPDDNEQMRRIEDPYAGRPEDGLDATRRAEAKFGAVGGGGVVDAEPATPRKPVTVNWLLIVIGVVVTLAGLVFMLQGLALLPGSLMSGVTFWAIVGPIIAIVGLVLIGFGFARRRRVSH